jgi:hypothetical protein
MTRIEGQIKTVRQHGGCVEITVDGPRGGTFTMNNCCAQNLFANEGPDLIGRDIEYRDGYLRFQDADSDTLPANATANSHLRIAS